MNNNKHRGYSLSTILVIIFIVLKLIGLITWSWIWVFSPWWISALLAILIVIFTSIGEWLNADDNIY